MDTIVSYKTAMKPIPCRELKRLRDAMNSSAHLPLSNLLLGDKMSDWTTKTWDHLTHHHVMGLGDDLHFRRVLRHQLKEHWHQHNENVNNNIFGDLVLDLVAQALDPDAGTLFAFRLALCQ